MARGGDRILWWFGGVLLLLSVSIGGGVWWSIVRESTRPALPSTDTPDIETSDENQEPSAEQQEKYLTEAIEQAEVCPDFSGLWVEDRLAELARDVQGSTLSLAEKLLVVSGVQQASELAHQSRQLETLVQKAIANVNESDPGQLALALRRALHQRVLTGYRAGASDMRAIIESGHFNCLSVTALFWLAAKAKHLPVSAYVMVGHTLPVVHLPDGPYLLEATNPDIPLVKAFGRKAAAAETHRTRRLFNQMLKGYEEAVARAQAAGDQQEVKRLQGWIGYIRQRADFNTDRRKAIELGISEVDEPALAAMFLYNLNPEQAHLPRQIRQYVAMLDLYQQSMARAREGVGMAGQICRRLTDRFGPGCGIDTASAMLKMARQPATSMRLRDVRAQLLLSWAEKANDSEREEIVQQAERLDPTHPTVLEMRRLLARSGH